MDVTDSGSDPPEDELTTVIWGVVAEYALFDWSKSLPVKLKLLQSLPNALSVIK